MGMREEVRGERVIGTICPIVMKDKHFLDFFFLSSSFCDFIINHRWIYRTGFELGMGPKVSEPLSHCFFLCISCPLFLEEEKSNTAVHSGSDKAVRSGMSQ